MFVALLYGIGILTFGILFLYFAKMSINTSDTFIDFAKKHISSIMQSSFYNDIRVNVILSALFLTLMIKEIFEPVTMIAFFFMVYRCSTILLKKHGEELKKLKEQLKEEKEKNE